MGKVISVRINKSLEEVLNKISKEQNNEQSEVIRDLIKNGSIFLAIKGFVEGKYSIGKAANLVEMPLSEFMDIIANLGIKSKINIEDVLEGYENLSKVLK
jgi:predicted HTH domain antitoxin